MNTIFAKSSTLAKTWAILTTLAVILSAFPASIFIAQAASTGITSDPVSRTLEVNEKGNFKISTIFDVASGTTAGTYISVSDNSVTGVVYGGNLNGTCSDTTDSQFSINQNKAFCYSNSVAGNYVVSIQLLDGEGGNAIGSPITVDVEVNAEITPTPILSCDDDSASNYEDEGECEYEGHREVITACKYNTNEEPIEGWLMVITNDVEGEGDITFEEYTEADGCVSVSVNEKDGPFIVVEEEREGWSYVSHSAYNGYMEGTPKLRHLF